MSDPRAEPKGGEPKGPCNQTGEMINSFFFSELRSSCREMEILARRIFVFEFELRKGYLDLDPEKLIGYGNDAVSALLSNQNFNIPCLDEHVDDGNPNRSVSSSMLVACILNLMGIACYMLKRYGESLSYLKWAERNLGNLDNDDASYCVHCLSLIWHVNQFQLYKVKRGIKFQIDECPDHMKNILEIKEKKTKGAICLELGDANRDVSFAYQLCGKFKEAVPYLAKALDIYEKCYVDSAEMVQFRRFLSFMYAGAEDYVEALEQIQLCKTVYESTGDNLGVLYTMVDKGSYLVLAKMYDDAIDVIGKVVTHTDAEKMLLAKAFQFLALACFHSGKFDDAIKHLESSSGILAKLVIDPHDQPQRQLFREHYDRLFKFIGIVCERKQAIKISLLEDVLGKLKKKFGQNSLEVAYCCSDLGTAYFESENFNRAAQNFACAKVVWDDQLGPSHKDTLHAQCFLAQSHEKMRRFDHAIELQENLIKLLAELGSQQKYEATKRRDEMKKGKSRGKSSQGCFMGWLLSFSGFFGFTSCFQAE